MTLEQYYNQCEKLPIGSIYLSGNEHDIQVHYHYPSITLSMNYKGTGEYFSYIVDRDTGILWTQDSDGNRKAPSVFRLSMDKINL